MVTIGQYISCSYCDLFILTPEVGQHDDWSEQGAFSMVKYLARRELERMAPVSLSTPFSTPF